jgi:hypothetical protein
MLLTIENLPLIYSQGSQYWYLQQGHGYPQHIFEWFATKTSEFNFLLQEIQTSVQLRFRPVL